MATFTGRDGRDMPVRFCGCAHAVTRHMAGGAIPRRSFEHTLDMAGFAPDQRMRARQVEARLHMVEFHRTGTGGLGQSEVRSSQPRKEKQEGRPPRHCNESEQKFEFLFMFIHDAVPQNFQTLTSINGAQTNILASIKIRARRRIPGLRKAVFGRPAVERTRLSITGGPRQLTAS